MDKIQVTVAGGEAAVTGHVQAVFGVEHQVDRRPHRHVGAHGCVHGEQRVLGGYFQRCRRLDATVENGTAVLTFTQLEVQRIFGCGQGISLRINQVEIGILAADLSAQQQVNVEIEGVAFEGSTVDVGDAANTVAYDACGFVQGVGLGETASGVEFLSQQRHDGLADGKAAAVQDYEYPLTGLDEPVHFAAYVHLIKAGVSP